MKRTTMMVPAKGNTILMTEPVIPAIVLLFVVTIPLSVAVALRPLSSTNDAYAGRAESIAIDPLAMRETRAKNALRMWFWVPDQGPGSVTAPRSPIQKIGTDERLVRAVEDGTYDEVGDGVGGENDEDADDARDDELLGLCDLFFATSGCHPLETAK